MKRQPQAVIFSYARGIEAEEPPTRQTQGAVYESPIGKADAPESSPFRMVGKTPNGVGDYL